MQIKLEYLTLLLTDEISMVGFKKFQDMNQTICSIKGSHDANWGNMCFSCGRFIPVTTSRTMTNLHVTTEDQLLK